MPGWDKREKWCHGHAVSLLHKKIVMHAEFGGIILCHGYVIESNSISYLVIVQEVQ